MMIDFYHSGLPCFSPRNGEIILKIETLKTNPESRRFQSPQWGNNSKVVTETVNDLAVEFQSPQWGNNSKVQFGFPNVAPTASFSPRNGEIILKGTP